MQEFLIHFIKSFATKHYSFRTMKNFLRVLTFLVAITLATTTAFADLEITVKPDARWGTAPTSNIKALCENVALHFQEQLRDEHKINGTLTVVYYADGPIAFYKSYFGGAPDEYRIGLTVTDTYWSQFAYQFGHEFCHLMQNHDETKNSPNDYFEEAICQLANLWVIKRMAETWEDRPPYANWRNYRHSLKSYADTLINKASVQYAGTGADWLQEWEDRMRSKEPGAFNYQRVSQLSYKFLPIFEDNPKAWNAVRQMPTSTAKMPQYIREWYNTVDTEDKPVVAAIAEEMGISLTPVATPDITAGHPLTFTYATADSLIPINKINEWDGWYNGIWEKTPDGTINAKPGAYFDFAEKNDWDHWMYCHAPSLIAYDISQGQYTHFGTYIALTNPGCNDGASMQFIAHADGIEIYRSPELGRDDYGTYIEFTIPDGTSIFGIEISDLGNKACDHYVLGNPKLFYGYETTPTHDITINADVNNDGYVDLFDVLIVRSGMQNAVTYDTDINNDGITDEIDLLIVKAKAVEAIVAAAPRKRKVKLTTWGSMKIER